MHMRAMRHPATGLLIGLSIGLLPVLFVVGRANDEPKQHFPDAFPGTHTDVGAARAFQDFALDVPASAEVVGYYAWSEDDEYPMAAVLRMPCSAVPGFVSRSGLHKASPGDGALTGVEVFATDHGWIDDDKDTRYSRDEEGTVQAVGVVIHRAGTECTTYLHT
jgi:hypothetical protein